MKLKAFFGLMRPGNCLIASIAVFVGYIVSTTIISMGLLLAVISAFLICGAGQAINDYFDAEIDKKTAKNKIIPSGKISKRSALIFSILLFLIGIIISFFVNYLAFGIAVIMSLLLIIYSSVLYKTKYIGNFVVALGTAITFVFGAAVTGNISLLIIFFAISALFANLSREITKDFEDIKKDAEFKKTLPMISKKAANYLVIFYYFLGISFASTAFVLFKLNIIYLFFTIVAAIIFVYSISLLKKQNYVNSQKNSKKGMLLSMVAYLSTIIK